MATASNKLFKALGDKRSVSSSSDSNGQSWNVSVPNEDGSGMEFTSTVRIDGDPEKAAKALEAIAAAIREDLS